MELHVYQSKDLYFTGREGTQAFLRGEHSLVAVVFLNKRDYRCGLGVSDESACEYAYEQTNTIHHYWWHNESVTKKFEGHGCRSTSVGDVVGVADSEGEEPREFYVVDSIGFKKIALAKRGR